MKIYDYSFKSPEENLACDEALLDERESSGGGGVLRFWSSPVPFAVLGYSNAWKSEVKNTRNLRVLRRASGGGTVLQGPGCLNYALILKSSFSGPLEHIRSTNEYIMARQCRALSGLLGKGVQVQGHTDLTLGMLKFSGNSQRRKKTHILFHGTFLLDFDLALIGRFLKTPPKQPAYRDNRPHAKFVTNLGLSEKSVKEALRKEWNATETLKKIPSDRISKLVEERYSRDEWNFKF